MSIAASFVHTLDTQESLLDLLFIGSEEHSYTAGQGLLRAQHLLEVLSGVHAQEAAALDRLGEALLSRRGVLTSCILVLCAWDARRERLVETLRRSGLQLLAIAVVPDGSPALPRGVHAVRLGHVQQDLAGL